MHRILKQTAAIWLSLLLFIQLFTGAARAVDGAEPLTVTVTIQQDNITLAVYEVELEESTVQLTAFGGVRAAMTLDANGKVEKISVNGQVLSADAEHEISVFHNGNPVEGGQVTVEPQDTILFKYSTLSVSSAAASSTAPDRPVMAVSSRAKRQTYSSSRGSSSRPKANSSMATSAASSAESTAISKSASVQSGELSSNATSSERALNPNRYSWDERLESSLENASTWLNLNGTGSVMQLVALSASGKPAKTSDVETFLQRACAKSGRYTDLNELANAVIGCAFCGVNAERARGVNLVEQLLALYRNTRATVSESAMLLIALDTEFYAQTDTDLRNTAVQQIQARQHKDGGFGKKKSDIQTTALVLTALANYKNLAGKTIASGVAYLSEQLKTGAYKKTSISDSMALIALNTLGYSLEDPRFLVDGRNLVEHLLTHENADGGFSAGEDARSDETATEYAVLALVSLKNGVSPFLLNYQSQTLDSETGEDAPPNTQNFYLTVILAALFCGVIALTALGFVFFKKKRRAGDHSEITYEYEE